MCVRVQVTKPELVLAVGVPSSAAGGDGPGTPACSLGLEEAQQLMGGALPAHSEYTEAPGSHEVGVLPPVATPLTSPTSDVPTKP